MYTNAYSYTYLHRNIYMHTCTHTDSSVCQIPLIHPLCICRHLYVKASTQTHTNIYMYTCRYFSVYRNRPSHTHIHPHKNKKDPASRHPPGAKKSNKIVRFVLL